VKRIVAYDDLHLRDGEEVTAEHVSVPLILGDRRVELDLTDVHLKELDELLGAYFSAGQTPPEGFRKAPPPPAKPRPTARRGRQPGPYNAGMRAFAESRGIPYRAGGLPNGKPYYSAALKAAYSTFLRNGGGAT
jgi:hypothetical protein